MKRMLIAGAVVSLGLIGASRASAELQLRSIMNGLGESMELVTRGIYTADFDLIEKNALQIADHDKPPMVERMKILGFLKAEAGKFKAADGVVHEEATSLAAAAKSKDIEKVLASYSGVMSGCVDCHASFRDRVIGHFYEGRQ